MNIFSAPEITDNYVQTGMTKTQLPVWKMLLLGVLAGMIIAIAATTANTAAHDISNVGLAKMASGLLFPFGLCSVLVVGAELFTGACLILISVLDGKVTVGAMLKNWLFVYIGNLIGSLTIAAGCAFSGQYHYSNDALAAYTIKVAAAKCALSMPSAVVMGIFCNLLVCMAIFMAFSAKDTAGRIMGGYLPIAMFVICGFEHSVANMYYIPAGLFAMQIPSFAAKAVEMGVAVELLTWGNFLWHLLFVTVGNIIGGTAFATLMWACHLKKRGGEH